MPPLHHDPIFEFHAYSIIVNVQDQAYTFPLDCCIIIPFVQGDDALEQEKNTVSGWTAWSAV